MSLGRPGKSCDLWSGGGSRNARNKCTFQRQRARPHWSDPRSRRRQISAAAMPRRLAPRSGRRSPADPTAAAAAAGEGGQEHAHASCCCLCLLLSPVRFCEEAQTKQLHKGGLLLGFALLACFSLSPLPAATPKFVLGVLTPRVVLLFFSFSSLYLSSLSHLMRDFCQFSVYPLSLLLLREREREKACTRTCTVCACRLNNLSSLINHDVRNCSY